jgi:hypothetical protein
MPDHYLVEDVFGQRRVIKITEENIGIRRDGFVSENAKGSTLSRGDRVCLKPWGPIRILRRIADRCYNVPT